VLNPKVLPVLWMYLQLRWGLVTHVYVEEYGSNWQCVGGSGHKCESYLKIKQAPGSCLFAPLLFFLSLVLLDINRVLAEGGFMAVLLLQMRFVKAVAKFLNYMRLCSHCTELKYIWCKISVPYQR